VEVTVHLNDLKAGDVLVDIIASLDSETPQYVVVDKGGQVTVNIRQGQPQVYLPLEALRDEVYKNQELLYGQVLRLSHATSQARMEQNDRDCRRFFRWALGLAGLGCLFARALSREEAHKEQKGR
jgi:hypothetical protein